jgi:hypothetical protein
MNERVINVMLGSQGITAQPNISLTDAREFPIPTPHRTTPHCRQGRYADGAVRPAGGEARCHRRLLDALLAEALAPDDDREMEAAE